MLKTVRKDPGEGTKKSSFSDPSFYVTFGPYYKENMVMMVADKSNFPTPLYMEHSASGQD